MSNTKEPAPSGSGDASEADHAATRAAHRLGNRGRLRVDAEGRVHGDILAAYWRTGFYVLEGALAAAEVATLEREFAALCERAPRASGATTDAQGRPAIGDAEQRRLFRFARPLTDPFGETEVGNGRYEVRMREGTPPADAPPEVLLQIGGYLQFSDAALHVYGHPRLLAVAEAINGADFTPFTESLWVKQAGLGPAVSWHQDGTTQWQSPALDAGTHGFNFMVNLYPTTPANALWVLPGTHRRKADLKAMMAASGSDRLGGTVPMLCQPGDVAICNRQVVHGSFPNAAGGRRATFVFGFHRRRSVLGTKGWAAAPYGSADIRAASRMIGLAIDARRQRFRGEHPYVYQPLKDERVRWDEANREALLRNYQKRAIGI